jgi:hypothetical protein
MKIYINLIIFLLYIINAQSVENFCKTSPMPLDDLLQIKQNIDQWSINRQRNEPIHILIAWHVVTRSNGTGDYSDQIIANMVEQLNINYFDHNFFFTLESIDRTANDTWFMDWEGQ